MEYVKNKNTIHFCVPVYNEEKILEQNILKLLNYLKKQNFPFTWKIIIVINGSTDNSLKIAKELASNNKNFIDYFETKKPGRGQALKNYWLINNADILVYMDVDLAVSLENIPNLINPFLGNQADLVIGSRLLSNSKIERSLIRELSSQGYNLLSRLILNHKFSDLQCGFKAVKTEKFKEVASHIKDKKWFFDTELIIFGKHFGWRIKEVPVDWSENRYEKRKSKVNILKDSSKFVVDLIKLRKRIKKLK